LGSDIHNSVETRRREAGKGNAKETNLAVRHMPLAGFAKLGQLSVFAFNWDLDLPNLRFLAISQET
jgi:hypothetical protein